jgi:hypothetical protein
VSPVNGDRVSGIVRWSDAVLGRCGSAGGIASSETPTTGSPIRGNLSATAAKLARHQYRRILNRPRGVGDNAERDYLQRFCQLNL